MPEDSTLPPELRTQLARFFARAWSDETLREEFALDPRAALAAAGIDWPAGLPIPELPERPRAGPRPGEPGGVGGCRPQHHRHRELSHRLLQQLTSR